MTTIISSEDREQDTKEKESADPGAILEKAGALGMQIMENCRNELYSQHPYLDGVFAALPVEMGEAAAPVGTDGWKLYMSPAFLLRSYEEDPAMIRRGYLHILLHCLYMHFCPDLAAENVGDGLNKNWNLAADMAVEWMLQEIFGEKTKKKTDLVEITEENSYRTEKQKKTVNQNFTTDSAEDIQNESQYHQKRTFTIGEVREQCFDIIRQNRKGGISAEQIEGMLKEGYFPFSDTVLEKCFAFDSHVLWYKKWHAGLAGLRKKWEDLLIRTGGKLGESRQRGSERGNQREEMDPLRKGRYDYRKFLKRFAVMREEVELDMESFDYIPYNFGMELYGNLPFIEPLEYKEVHKMEELVIAIDTSSSCSREMVQRFLNETYSILNEKENFFRKFKVYLIQCDCFLQEAVVLHNEEEWKEYIKNVQIQGRSGTDFRPVFQYVEELRRKRELRDLKALIYFTDGDGIYPESATEYETAFVFLKKNDYMDMVPKWAMRLVTD